MIMKRSKVRDLAEWRELWTVGPTGEEGNLWSDKRYHCQMCGRILGNGDTIKSLDASTHFVGDPEFGYRTVCSACFQLLRSRGVDLPSLTPEEALRFMNAADSVRDKAIISLSLAGLTADAISKLRVKDLDLQRGSVRW